MRETMTTGLGAAEAPRVIPAAGRSRRDRWFFTGMALAAAVTVFIGFAQSYYLRSFSTAPALSPFLHFHGLLFTAWILLFVGQTGLVAAGRTDLHQRMGVLSAGVALLMPFVGLIAAIGAAERGFTPPGGPPPLVFLAIPLGDLAVFSILAGAGLSLRRRSQSHKRLMLLATIGLLTPALARIPFIGAGGPPAFFGVTDLFVVACLVYDRLAHGRVHPAFLWGGIFLIASQPARLAIAGTGAWLSFATWLVR
jgi:hypothetical protein